VSRRSAKGPLPPDGTAPPRALPTAYANQSDDIRRGRRRRRRAPMRRTAWGMVAGTAMTTTTAACLDNLVSVRRRSRPRRTSTVSSLSPLAQHC
jgi:hypothetical protein